MVKCRRCSVCIGMDADVMGRSVSIPLPTAALGGHCAAQGCSSQAWLIELQVPVT